MIKILILDDSDEKVIQITKIIRSIDVRAEITIATDIISAKKAVNANKYDILVLDQFLPIRVGDEISQNGGIMFLKEIQQNRFNNIPRSIFGLSISDNIVHEYFWPFFIYNQENIWHKPFKSLVNYTNLYKQKYDADEVENDDIWKIYVEGVTDFLILDKCLELFFPFLKKDISIEYEIGSGASWVVRQLFARVFMLPKKSDGSIKKCVAVFDNDVSGNNAHKRINEVIPLLYVERKYFKIFKYQSKLSPVFKDLNLLINEICLEDLLPPSVWISAEDNCLLSNREVELLDLNKIDSLSLFHSCQLIEPEISNCQSISYLKIYSKKFFDDENKRKIISDFLKKDKDYLINALLPYKLLLQNIISYFEKS